MEGLLRGNATEMDDLGGTPIPGNFHILVRQVYEVCFTTEECKSLIKNRTVQNIDR